VRVVPCVLSVLGVVWFNQTRFVQLHDCVAANAWGGGADPQRPELALFGALSLFNHSCSPNALFSPRVEDTYERGAVVRALAPIASGESVCVSYCPPHVLNASAEERRRYVLDNWAFVCACELCERGEAGSFRMPSDAVAGI